MSTVQFQLVLLLWADAGAARAARWRDEQRRPVEATSMTQTLTQRSQLQLSSLPATDDLLQHSKWFCTASSAHSSTSSTVTVLGLHHCQPP